MAARIVAPEFPIRTYPNPVIAEQVVIEWVTSELANSQPVEPGARHPNAREFSGFKLGIQRVDPRDPYYTQRVWVNDQVDHQEAYSYALKYLAASNAHPVFVRSDRELKTSYTPRTKGTALQSVYKLVITNAGTGYTVGTKPVLTFAGGAGSGATGHALVGPTGTVVELIIESGGTGYTSSPTFTIAAPPSGTTATGTAAIQPTAVLLVDEEPQQFPQDSEFYALYFNVVRVYKTFPGPPLYDRSTGVEDHTPPKYRNQTTRTVTITDPVLPSASLSALSGDRVFSRVKDNSVAEATKFDVDTTINENAQPRVGQQTGEYGIETIAESYVNEGTAADSGFGVKDSSVEPSDEPGKSEKRTIRWPDAGVAEVLITTTGGGYTDGTYSLGFTGGAGAGGAAGTYVVLGGVVTRATMTAMGIYTALPTPAFPSGGGSGAVGLALEGHPAKISRLYDEEMQVTYPRSEQIIQVITDAQAALLQAQSAPGEMKELIGIDVWHSKLVKETKVPTAVDVGTAILSTATRPFSFPGLFPGDVGAYILGGFPNGVIFPGHVTQARGDLVKVNILTYWVTNTTGVKPNIAIDEIITDSMLVPTFPFNFSDLWVTYRQYENVLHDEETFDIRYIYGTGVTDTVVYPATTPSYSQYIATWQGHEKIIAASVTATKQKNQWRVQIERTVMR